MKKIASILMILLMVCSCSSNDIETTESNNFYALTEGNSWEYKYYVKDNVTNNFEATTITETVNITHTAAIDGIIYYNFKHIVVGNDGNTLLPENGEQNFMLRDSLGFLINQMGKIKYSNNNYEEHFVSHIDDISFNSYNLKLSNDEDIITVDNLGDFYCLDNHYFIRDVNGNQLNSTDHIYREDGKGEILSTLSYASQSEHFAEKRLEAYTIQ
ncbi:hypothetical protein [Psychroserpens luteus]|uniref:DKNYY family protein n=1 Tax=Psychroserpens luteus TaxID=1434066 RepID=A0ABW5ZNM4_9FLAO|nr:hypothetical protein [Psychroserpens luteus]